MKEQLKRIYRKLRGNARTDGNKTLLLLGKQMAWQVAGFPPNADFRKVGFKVFSQWDEDGIIQYLISNLAMASKTFIEFGVEDYAESNTRFLLVNNHWQGMVLDANPADIRCIQRDNIYWQYDLQAKNVWITQDNIDLLLRDSGFPEDLGLLSIDIDGNDYWIWEAIQSVRPRILIIEYNSLFGLQPIAVPYQQNFHRTSAHYSNLYYGSSLAALHCLARKKGYLLVGSNIWGHNAFFLRADIAGEFKGLDPEEAYVAGKFRESRDRDGHLTYTRGEARLKLIDHLPVVNVLTGRTGRLSDFF